MPDAGVGQSRVGSRRPTTRASLRPGPRRTSADADGDDVLCCRSRSYRAPDWNDGRKVLDPLGRYLEPDYVASDELCVVRRRSVAGEDPRGADVRAALAAR